MSFQALNSSYEPENDNFECFLHCPDSECIINELNDEICSVSDGCRNINYLKVDHSQLPHLLITDDDFIFDETANEVIIYFFSDVMNVFLKKVFHVFSLGINS